MPARFNNTVPVITTTEHSPVAVVFSEAILHVLPAVLAFFASVLAGAGIAMLQRDAEVFVNSIAIGLIASALVMLAVSAKKLVNVLEIGLNLDLNRDGTIGGVTIEAEDEIELESRIDRFLRAITEQGASHTRHHICDELGLLTQSEWQAVKNRCISTGILSIDGTKLMAVSYKQARDMWSEGLSNHLINIGERGNPKMVRSSGLKLDS